MSVINKNNLLIHDYTFELKIDIMGKNNPSLKMFNMFLVG